MEYVSSQNNKDMACVRFRCHDIELLGSRDILTHVTIRVITYGLRLTQN